MVGICNVVGHNPEGGLCHRGIPVGDGRQRRRDHSGDRKIVKPGYHYIVRNTERLIFCRTVPLDGTRRFDRKQVVYAENAERQRNAELSCPVKQVRCEPPDLPRNYAAVRLRYDEDVFVVKLRAVFVKIIAEAL